MAFSQADLAKAVNDAFAVSQDIPTDHRGAFVTIANEHGVTAVVAHKIDDHWTVTGQIDHPWSGGLDYGATIQATW